MPAVEIQVRPRVNRSWLPSALGLFTRLASQERWLRWDYLRRVEWAVAVRARGPNGERLVPHRNGASSRTALIQRTGNRLDVIAAYAIGTVAVTTMYVGATTRISGTDAYGYPQVLLRSGCGDEAARI
jgi:hypothetical protein